MASVFYNLSFDVMSQLLCGDVYYSGCIYPCDTVCGFQLHRNHVRTI